LGNRVIVAVALGSNLGDRRAHLDFAVGRLRELLEDLQISPVHETDPVGVADHQPRFLNAVVAGNLDLLGRRPDSVGPRVGEVLPTRWVE